MVSNAATADLSALVRRLRDAGTNARRASDQILDEAATSVERLMRTYAPVDTGRLFMAIRTVKGPGRREIGPFGVEYAKYQEFGTATRGEFGGTEYTIKPRDPNGRLHFQIQGKWISAKEVRHPGVPPHPFARPAAREAVQQLGKKYGEMGSLLITEGRYHRAS